MRIALLCVPGNYAIDALVALNAETPFFALDKNLCGEALPQNCRPISADYGLPCVGDGETVVIDSAWLTRAGQSVGESPLRVLETLRTRFNKLILLDCASPFQLGLPNAWMDKADAILKVNGVYRNPEFYGYVLGAPTPDGNWTDTVRAQAVPQRISRENGAKLHANLPCTIGIVPAVRQKTRRFYCASPANRALRLATETILKTLPAFDRKARRTVHFAGSLTHIQRLDALRQIKKSGLSWDGGLTRVPEWITGWRGAQMTKLSSEERDNLQQELQSEGLLTAPQNRVRYSAGMRECKAVLSVAGYGEMCFRMAEAWAAQRVLICQDVSHAQTLFPIENGRNAVFCKPDLSDLVDILDDIECNTARYAPIARQGYDDWRDWCKVAPETVRQGFAPLFSSVSVARVARPAVLAPN